jgi:hypothetical protein
MRAVQWLFAALIGFGAASANAQGPVLDPVPANTCPSGKNLKLVWVANEAATDGGGVGPGFAETMVVCHSTEKTGGKNLDLYVQLYDFGGLPVSTASACDVMPGHTAAFVTGLPFPPYIPVGGAGAFTPLAPVVPPGSLRILGTKPKIVCDVTLYDTGGPAAGFSPGPAWSKDVTVTKAKAPQKGD